MSRVGPFAGTPRRHESAVATPGARARGGGLRRTCVTARDRVDAIVRTVVRGNARDRGFADMEAGSMSSGSERRIGCNSVAATPHGSRSRVPGFAAKPLHPGASVSAVNTPLDSASRSCRHGQGRGYVESGVADRHRPNTAATVGAFGRRSHRFDASLEDSN